jgi:HEAT repeat protein
MADPKQTQPAPKVRGGVTRPSTRVDRTELPALAARERIMAFLRGHDPETQDRAAQHLDDADFAVIRIIAQEGAATNTEPPIRYNAIAALARGARPANLNLLVDLAQFGEDFYVRGHAVLALGATGLYLSLGAIATHLSAEESFEQLAARRAIGLLARRGSLEGVRVHAALVHDAKLRATLEHVLDTLEKNEHRPDNPPHATSSRERPT